MDDFDAVLNFEASHFARGDADGRRDAVESGELREIGAKSGFMKGLAYGLEVGFYRATALERLAHEAAATSAAVALSSSSPSPAAAAATNRPLKWASQLSQRTDAFPTSNVAAFDFDNEVRELRGLFRLSGCAAQVGGPFRPPTSIAANNDVVAAAAPAAPPEGDNVGDPGTHVFTSLTPAAFDW